MSCYTEFREDDVVQYLNHRYRSNYTIIDELPLSLREWVRSKYPDTLWFRVGAIQGLPNGMLWWMGGWNLGEHPSTRRTPDWEDHFVTQLLE